MQSLEWEVLYLFQRPHAVSTQRWHAGLLVLNAIFRKKDVYDTDVNIICHAKNVIKYVDINIFRQ